MAIDVRAAPSLVVGQRAALGAAILLIAILVSGAVGFTAGRITAPTTATVVNHAGWHAGSPLQDIRRHHHLRHTSGEGAPLTVPPEQAIKDCRTHPHLACASGGSVAPTRAHTRDPRP
jgi:hypothetical protein